MEGIEIKCSTNLDGYDCTVVRRLQCRPIIGDYIKVYYKGNVSKLKIVSITHCSSYLNIELHN